MIKKIVKSYLNKKARNIPTNKNLWDSIQDLVAGRKKSLIHDGKKIIGPRDGKGFKIHPSAYSNGYAAKLYKELGGSWKKEAKSKRDKGSEHGGLDAWFGKDTPWGNWIAITPVKKTVELEDGTKKTYKPGDIVGPCGISNSPEWKDVTQNGTQPLKCMARPQAEKYTRKERAELAKFKRKKEKEQGKSTKVTLTPSFGDKAKEILKKKIKAYLKNSKYYISLKLTDSSREKVLSKFKPKFTTVLADHVTYHWDVSKDAELPKIKSIKVVGYASDEYLETLVVLVDGKLKSPDGRIFHITLSLDPSKRKAMDSNKLIESGWKEVAPFDVQENTEIAEA